MAALSCLALVSAICVLSTADLDNFTVKQGGSMLYGSVKLTGDGWEVAQTTYSDCIDCIPAPRTQFLKTCSDAACVSYYRECDDAKHPTICDYYVDRLLPITVAVKSEEDFSHLVASLGVKMVDGVMPLSALSQEGPGPRRGPPVTNYLRSPPSGGGTP